ncbi:MAG TPA: SPOR domain-containing protein [Bryobacteraceae bacterium]|jgi:cell division septation protein DedD
MLRSSETETEILLGNKQLLGIFFLVAVLIGVAFGGGYMLGRGSGGKKAAGPAVTSVNSKDTAAPSPANPAGGETRTVSPPEAIAPDTNTPSDQPSETPALGSPKHRTAAKAEAALPEVAAPADASPNFLPQSGQEFLQVAAVPRNEALSVADVLRKKGFRAHAVPVPGNVKLYRVIVGPLRDVADLSSTREELRKTGFGKVIVQKY